MISLILAQTAVDLQVDNRACSFIDYLPSVVAAGFLVFGVYLAIKHFPKAREDWARRDDEEERRKSSKIY